MNTGIFFLSSENIPHCSLHHQLHPTRHLMSLSSSIPAHLHPPLSLTIHPPTWQHTTSTPGLLAESTSFSPFRKRKVKLFYIYTQVKGHQYEHY